MSMARGARRRRCRVRADSGLAADAGGFDALTWDRALVVVAAVALVLVILLEGASPGPFAAVFLAALVALSAWTALSWLWSESPPRALVEAQRVALYSASATLVVLAGRRVSTEVAHRRRRCRLHVRCRSGISPPHVHGVAHSSDDRRARTAGRLCEQARTSLRARRRCAAALAASRARRAPGSLSLISCCKSSRCAGALAFSRARSTCSHTRPRTRRVLAVVAVLLVAPRRSRSAGTNARSTGTSRCAKRAREPLLGSGAGTFADWWLRERSTPISTREAHSLYLETLAELGPLGLALLLVALAAPLSRQLVPAAGRSRPPRRVRQSQRLSTSTGSLPA